MLNCVRTQIIAECARKIKINRINGLKGIWRHIHPLRHFLTLADAAALARPRAAMGETAYPAGLSRGCRAASTAVIQRSVVTESLQIDLGLKFYQL